MLGGGCFVWQTESESNLPQMDLESFSPPWNMPACVKYPGRLQAEAGPGCTLVSVRFVPRKLGITAARPCQGLFVGAFVTAIMPLATATPMVAMRLAWSGEMSTPALPSRPMMLSHVSRSSSRSAM